jgi:hypothetical protein
MHYTNSITTYFILLSFSLLLTSCDVFIKGKNSSEETKEETKKVRNLWEGLYGGAVDVYIRDRGELELYGEDKEVNLAIRFMDESNDIDNFFFNAPSYYNTGLTDDPSAPTKITKDSLIMVDREGKYQTDYLIERNGQQLDGEARVFEQDSEGNFELIELYDFAATLSEN